MQKPYPDTLATSIKIDLVSSVEKMMAACKNQNSHCLGGCLGALSRSSRRLNDGHCADWGLSLYFHSERADERKVSAADNREAAEIMARSNLELAAGRFCKWNCWDCHLWAALIVALQRTPRCISKLEKSFFPSQHQVFWTFSRLVFFLFMQIFEEKEQNPLQKIRLQGVCLV